MELFLLWFGVAVVTGLVGSSKGRSGFGWFLLGALFSALALVLLALLPSMKRDPLAPSPETHVRCPDCRELVYQDAKKCKHCGILLVPSHG
jgi:membrane protein implicated in regulation of membrane protease activity